MKKLTTQLTVRVTSALRKTFLKKAKVYGDPSAIHRELLLAFVEDRMTITQPASNDEKSLYK
jgi:hypothetical protein